MPRPRASGSISRRHAEIAPPLTALAVAAELDRYPPSALPFAQTHLKRGLNQVVAALEEARERVATALPARSS